jgi:anti-anti-sigma factor
MKNKTFNIKTLINKVTKVQTIIFEGDLGIKNAEAIKKVIQKIKFSDYPVTLHLKNIEKLDITSIQIIRVLRKDLIKKGGETDLILEISQNIEQLLKNTGFDRILSNKI